MLVEFPLLLTAIAFMTIAALAVDLVRDLVFKTHAVSPARFSDRILVNLLFFAMLPATLYVWFYPLVPFSGVRVGIFLALLMFLLAIAPTFAVFHLHTPDQKPATLGHLFWLAIKYLLVYGTLTITYQP